MNMLIGKLSWYLSRTVNCHTLQRSNVAQEFKYFCVMNSMHLKGVHAVSWGISASQINICICVALPLEAGF